MVEQLTPYNCGPASIQNAIKALRKKAPSQTKIAELCRTSEEGTDEEGIKRALVALGYEIDEWKSDDVQESMVWLVDSLCRGLPVVLCVDRWLHWVTAIGHIGDQFLVFDPARYPHLTVEHHVRVWTRQRMKKSWQASHNASQQELSIYGIAVWKGTIC